MTTPPSYLAKATLIIDSRKVQLFQQQSILGDIPVDTASVASQVEVLKSENIAQSVLKELRLTQDREFVGSGGGLLGTLLDFVINPFGSSEPKSDFELTRRAMRVFQDRLTVRRIGFTYAIEIGFESLSADRAAQVANAVADAYIVDQLEAKYQATRRASAWLQNRIRELRDQASAAERAVVEFKTKNNIVTTGGSNPRLMGEQQVSELNSQLVIARAQASEAKARLDRIQTVLHADSPDATVNATVADTLKNEVITKLRTQYLELANREANWSARYGSNHLATVNLRNQMREIRNSILDELRRIAESYKSDYEIAKQREQGIQKELSQSISQAQDTNKAQVVLRELESNAQTYRSLYDNFLQRYMETVQQQSFPITDTRVISPATRPLQRNHPKTALVFAICGLVGLVLGIGIGMLRDMSDRVFRTNGQVERLLQTTCLAVIPILKGRAPAEKRTHPAIHAAITGFKKLARRLLPGSKASNEAEQKAIPRAKNLLWTVVNEPFSRFSEAIRAVKLAVDLNCVVKANKVIGITSSLPEEGKSTVAVAVAQMLALGGRPTILVDCDIRNPSTTRRLVPHARAGLLEVIAGENTLDSVIWKDTPSKMLFLPTVVKSRLANSSDILASEAMKKLFAELRQTYDYVVVDLSPLAPIVDVRATTSLVDSYVMVIEWGKTKVDVVQHALSEAPGVTENLLGAVLNKADMAQHGRYEGYRQSYYYNKSYGRYGYHE
jgi:succinoglycan biosynthesis transport protein ExoP